MSQSKHIGVYALITRHNEVLLIKKARGHYTGKLDLPGGGLEFGETSQEALKREVKEETGLMLTGMDLIDFVTHVEQQELYHLGSIYKVTVEGILNEKGDGEDSAGAQWYKISDLKNTQLTPFVIHSLSLL